MNILALDTSGKACSVAIAQKDKLVCEFYLDHAMNHSQALMPMLHAALEQAKISIEEIDLIGVAVGPGSFTGIRIGVCAAKALGQALKKPIAAISTLAALYQKESSFPGIVCPILDARRNQVYAAAYQNGKPILPECAIAIEDLAAQLKPIANGCAILFLGDGVPVHQEYLKTQFEMIYFPSMLLQRAGEIAFLANQKATQNDLESYQTLLPNYLRIPQAEQVRKQKTGKKSECK